MSGDAPTVRLNNSPITVLDARGESVTPEQFTAQIDRILSANPPS
ncbi:hypothetical protein ACU686_03730 [Yinghuangia aomiensis]